MFFMAGKVVKAFGNIGQSIRGWAAVKRGDLGFFEFSGMNADELDDWLKKYDGEASRIQQQIDRKTAELRSVIPRGTTAKGRGKYADQIKQIKDEIATLEKAKADLAAKTAAAHIPTTTAKVTGDSGGGASKRDAVIERGQAAIKDLERELALLGDTTEIEKVLWELENGRYADLSTAHKARIETLTREIQAGKEAIDAKKAEADAAEEADKQRIASMDQLMGRMQEYYEEHDSAVANFEDDYRQAIMTTQEYELARLQERYDAYAEHIDDKVALDKWYEEEKKKIADSGKNATSELTEFQIQAYRSMQSAMSEFLFDPFEDGLDGMLRSFADMIRKMLAEALAAQILKSLLGGSFGSGGSIGGLLGGLFGSAKGNAFSGGRVIPFAHGGIVDRPTVFPMAQGAGLMGEAGPEAVLPLARTAGGDLGVNVASEKQQDPIENNVRIINVLDPSVVGNYLSTAAGERLIVNYMQRNKRVLT
jgi:phage-related minor tail protein